MMNIKYVKNQLKSINELMAPLSNYISEFSKTHIISSINNITRELSRNTDMDLEEYTKKSSGLVSIIVSLPSVISNQNYQKMLYNRYQDFLVVTRWYIYKERGMDVGESPWDVPEEEKEDESEDDVNEVDTSGIGADPSGVGTLQPGVS